MQYYKDAWSRALVSRHLDVVYSNYERCFNIGSSQRSVYLNIDKLNVTIFMPKWVQLPECVWAEWKEGKKVEKRVCAYCGCAMTENDIGDYGLCNDCAYLLDDGTITEQEADETNT